MDRRWRICGLAALALGGCTPDDSQLAEAYLFNRPAAKIRACFGEPDRRIPVGIEQIWVYRIGRLHVEGWVAAFDADEHPTFSAPTPDCAARFTVDPHGVPGIAYTDIRGRPIPQAERCEIAVRK